MPANFVVQWKWLKPDAVIPAADADSWEGLPSAGAGGSDRGSDGMASTMAGAGRRGMFAALRIEDLGVIGEKGTKVGMPRNNTPHNSASMTIMEAGRCKAPRLLARHPPASCRTVAFAHIPMLNRKFGLPSKTPYLVPL